VVHALHAHIASRGRLHCSTLLGVVDASSPPAHEPHTRVHALRHAHQPQTHVQCCKSTPLPSRCAHTRARCLVYTRTRVAHRCQHSPCCAPPARRRARGTAQLLQGLPPAAAAAAALRLLWPRRRLHACTAAPPPALRAEACVRLPRRAPARLCARPCARAPLTRRAGRGRRTRRRRAPAWRAPSPSAARS
jgi:hypothetical protein